MGDRSRSTEDVLSDIRNEQTQNARFAVAHIIAEALSELAEVLRKRAHKENDKTLYGLSIIAGMASRTGLGALALYHEEMWYAGPH
jgi:hypothetical protein